MKKLFTILALTLTTLSFSSAQTNLSQGGTGWNNSTLGDLLVGTSSTLRYTRLPIGSTGQVLWVSGGRPAWVATSSLGIGGGGSGTVTSVSAVNNATGLTVSSTTCNLACILTFSLTAGYSIPLTASTTNWNSFFDTPSTRITAGSNLIWSGNTLNFNGILPVGNGGTGTSTTPTLGQLLLGNNLGGYNLVSTSSLGISSVNLLPLNNLWTGTNSFNATSTLFSLVTSLIRASTSAGIILQSNNGTQIADFGAGGGSNATFNGGVTIQGQTSLVNASSTNFGTNNLYASSSISLRGLFNDSKNDAGTLGQVLSSTGTSTIWSTLSATLTGGQTGFIPRWLSGVTIGTSTLLDNGIVSGVNATSSLYSFNVQSPTSTPISPFSISSSTGQVMFHFGVNGRMGVSTTQPAALFHVGFGSGVVASTTNAGNGQLVEFSSNFNTPYFSSGQYQNFLIQTEDFSNVAWVKQGVGTVTANNVINPQGLLIAESIPPGTASTSGVFQVAGNTSSGTFALSVWLRSRDANATTSLSIDTRNGVATTTGIRTIVNLTPQWQRFSIVSDTGAGARTALIANIYNGTSQIAVWGAQLEATTTRSYSGAQTTASTSILTNRNTLRGATFIDSSLSLFGTLTGVTSITMAGALSGVTTLGMNGALSGVTTAALSNTLTQTMTALATSTAAVIRGYYGVNSTAATVSLNQQSPAIELEGKVWQGVSQPANWRIQNTFPATSTPFATSSLDFTGSINNAATNTVLSLKSSGLVGIGTTSPTATLTVRATSSNALSGIFSVFTALGSSIFNILNGGQIVIGTTTAPTFGFTVATTTQFTAGVVSRVVGYTWVASTTININTTDVATSTIIATTTLVNPVGTAFDGQMFQYAALATSTRQIFLDTQFATTTGFTSPITVSSGTTYLLFQRNNFRSRWDFISVAGSYN